MPTLPSDLDLHYYAKARGGKMQQLWSYCRSPSSKQLAGTVHWRLLLQEFSSHQTVTCWQRGEARGGCQSEHAPEWQEHQGSMLPQRC